MKGKAMDLKIDIDPKQVEESVVKAILEASLGETIKAEVEKALNENQMYSSDNIFKRSIKQEIQTQVGQAIKNEIQKRSDKIEKIVKAKIDEAVLDEMVGAAIDIMTGRIKITRDF